MILTVKEIVLSFFFALSFCIGFSQNADSIKCWRINDKLKWDDFKGEVPLNEVQSTTVAVCPYDLIVEPFRENGILNYKVRVVFFKNQAWTKNASSYTLAHEQLHFDIAELHARKLRKSIKEIRIKQNPNAAKYKLAIEKMLSEDNQMQSDYDLETAHGLAERSQSEWNVKIAKELDSLKEYTSDIEDCK